MGHEPKRTDRNPPTHWTLAESRQNPEEKKYPTRTRVQNQELKHLNGLRLYELRDCRVLSWRVDAFQPADTITFDSMSGFRVSGILALRFSVISPSHPSSHLVNFHVN